MPGENPAGNEEMRYGLPAMLVAGTLAIAMVGVMNDNSPDCATKLAVSERVCPFTPLSGLGPSPSELLEHPIENRPSTNIVAQRVFMMSTLIKEFSVSSVTPAQQVNDDSLLTDRLSDLRRSVKRRVTPVKE